MCKCKRCSALDFLNRAAFVINDAAEVLVLEWACDDGRRCCVVVELDGCVVSYEKLLGKLLC